MLWGQFLHSQRDLKRRNRPRANTLYPYKRVAYGNRNAAAYNSAPRCFVHLFLLRDIETYLFQLAKDETELYLGKFRVDFMMIKILKHQSFLILQTTLKALFLFIFEGLFLFRFICRSFIINKEILKVIKFFK